MPVFEYIAVDKQGRKRQGILSAQSPQAVRQILSDQHLFLRFADPDQNPAAD